MIHPKKHYSYILILITLLLISCNHSTNRIEPQLSFSVEESYLKQLPSSFSSLTKTEADTPWGKEHLIAQQFAENLDLYRAITTFKRAEFLIPSENTQRLQEIQYQILLSYYLGKRYEQVIYEFNHSLLYGATPTFSAYHDLLILVYESYLEINNDAKASYILKIIEHHYPDAAHRLKISDALMSGNFQELKTFSSSNSELQQFHHLETYYNSNKKSVQKAKLLNAGIPGAGFLYLGQKQSALTAFLLNSLFIWASIQCYANKHYAAGAILTSFEAGWYFGGIYGAGENAKLYNERLYENMAYPILKNNNYFPVLMLQASF